MDEPAHKKTPRDLLRAIFRRRLLFVSGAALFAFATLVGACWWPLKYTAIAKFERRSDPASEDLVRGKSESFDALKMTLQHELIGTNAVEAAVEGLEKKRLLPTLPRGQDGKLTADGRMLRQELVRDLSADLKAVFDVRSQEVDLVSVSFTDKDPRLAQELPNTLITNYIDRMSEQIVTNLTSSRDFLKNKAAEASTLFAELTRKRIDFEIKNAGMMPENPGALRLEIQRVTSDMDTIRRQQTLAKLKLDQIKTFLRGATPQDADSSSPSAGKPEAKPPDKDAAAAAIAEKPASPSTMAIEQEYADAKQELVRLQDQRQQYQRSLDEARTLMHMTDKHPKAVALKKQIDDLDKRIVEAKARMPDLEKRVTERRDLERRLGSGRDGAVAGATPADVTLDPLRQRDVELQQANLVMQEAMVQSEYQMATKELERLQAHLTKLNDSMSNFGPVRNEYLGLLKEVADQQAEVDRWQKRQTEVQMALAAEAAKHRTHLNQVELAPEQFRPSSPKLLYVLALALVGGLAFGGGLVFLINTVDRSIATTEEAAEYFALPVLGTIGEITTPAQKARRKILRWGLGPVAALVVVLAIAFAALNITLLLDYCEQYDEWKSSPARFVTAKIGNLFNKNL
jgi:uncharacterized protein involved in exopolysaccharide biosynthesis